MPFDWLELTCAILAPIHSRSKVRWVDIFGKGGVGALSKLAAAMSDSQLTILARLSDRLITLKERL